MIEQAYRCQPCANAAALIALQMGFHKLFQKSRGLIKQIDRDQSFRQIAHHGIAVFAARHQAAVLLIKRQGVER